MFLLIRLECMLFLYILYARDAGWVLFVLHRPQHQYTRLLRLGGDRGLVRGKGGLVGEGSWGKRD